MPDRPRSSRDLINDALKEVGNLPPGADVAGFISAKAKEFEALFAKEAAQAREDASREAGFSPSGVPPLRPSGDEAGEDSPAKNRRPPRG